MTEHGKLRAVGGGERVQLLCQGHGLVAKHPYGTARLVQAIDDEPLRALHRGPDQSRLGCAVIQQAVQGLHLDGQCRKGVRQDVMHLTGQAGARSAKTSARSCSTWARSSASASSAECSTLASWPRRVRPMAIPANAPVVAPRTTLVARCPVRATAIAAAAGPTAVTTVAGSMSSTLTADRPASPITATPVGLKSVRPPPLPASKTRPAARTGEALAAPPDQPGRPAETRGQDEDQRGELSTCRPWVRGIREPEQQR